MVISRANVMPCPRPWPFGRVLFQWRNARIHAYPAMLYVGLVTGVIAGTYAGSLSGLDTRRVYAGLLGLVLPALVGARLLCVASHWEVYRREPHRIWRRSEGGASLYGGLALALLTSLPLLRVLGVPFWTFWDAATFTLVVGMIFTKVGCMLNGCCAGRSTSGRVAIYLPNAEGVWCRRVPTQLLEAALAFALLLTSMAVWRHLPFPGGLFLLNVAAYSLGRLGLEATRETIDRLGPFSLHRVISVILAGLSVASFLYLWSYGTDRH